MSGVTDDGSTEMEDHATTMRVWCPSPEFPASSDRFNDPADAVSEQHTDAVRVCQPSQISLSAGVDNGVGAMSEHDNTVALSLKSQSSQVYFMIGCQRSGSNWLRTMLSDVRISSHHILHTLWGNLCHGWRSLEIWPCRIISGCVFYFWLVRIVNFPVLTSPRFFHSFFASDSDRSCSCLRGKEPSAVARLAWSSN